MKNEKLVEATMLALQGKLEARNPENDEINNKISKTLNGSTKYMDDLVFTVKQMMKIIKKQNNQMNM